MALSGNKEQSFIAPGVSTSSYYWFDVSYVVNSQNVHGNYSNITVTLITWTTRASNICSYNTGEYTIPTLKVNRAEKADESNKLYLDYRTCRPSKSNAKTLVTWTGNVPHNDDGTLTLNITAGMFYPGGGTSLTRGDYSVEASFTVDPIAREFTLSIPTVSGITITVKKNGTAISSGTTLYPNDKIKISWTVQEYYTVQNIKLGSEYVTSNGQEKTITNSATITATVNRQKSSINCTFDVSINTDTGSADDIDRGTSYFVGTSGNIFIRLFTILKIIPHATTDQDATITSIYETVGKRTYTNNSVNILHAFAEPVRNFVVTDSSGNSKEFKLDLSASPYKMVDYFNVSGVGSAKWSDVQASTAIVTAEYSALLGRLNADDPDAPENSFNWRDQYAKYRVVGSNTWIDIPAGSLENDLSWTVPASEPSRGNVEALIYIPNLDYTKSYEIKVFLVDSVVKKWGSPRTGYDNYQPLAGESTFMLPSKIPPFEWGPNDFKFNVPALFSSNGLTSDSSFKVNISTYGSYLDLTNAYGGVWKFGSLVIVNLYLKCLQTVGNTPTNTIYQQVLSNLPRPVTNTAMPVLDTTTSSRGVFTGMVGGSGQFYITGNHDLTVNDWYVFSGFYITSDT